MNEELEQTQITIEEAKAKVAKAEQVRELIGNPLFDEVITKGFLGDDAVRLSMTIKPTTDGNSTVFNMLQAKAIFSRYLGEILDEGHHAMQSIEDNSELERQILKEEMLSTEGE